MQDRLHEFIDSVSQASFQWGELDCVTFADAAMRAHNGISPFDFIFEGREPPYDDLRGAVEFWASCKKRLGSDPIALVDERWERYMTLHPQHGMLVGRQVKDGSVIRFSFGIVVDDACVVMTTDGTAHTLPEVHDYYWRVE